MQHFGDNFIPVIPVEDDLPLHTDIYPFCSASSCACHRDPDLLAPVEQAFNAGLLTSEEAMRIVQGKAL